MAGKGKAAKGKPPKGRTPSKAPRTPAEVRLAEHPRAKRQIALAKSYAGLAAFAIVAHSAWREGLGFVDVASRALMWGIAAYVVVWAMAVYVWRHVAVAEVRAAEKRWRERKDAEQEQVAKLRAALEENGMPSAGTGAMPPG